MALNNIKFSSTFIIYSIFVISCIYNVTISSIIAILSHQCTAKCR